MRAKLFKTQNSTTPIATPIATQKQIFDAIKANPKVSRVELARVIGITPDGVKYHLGKMTAAGLIARVGSARGGHWRCASAVTRDKKERP